MKKFWDEYGNIVIIVVIAIIILMVIYFWGKSQGKKYVPQDVDLPEGEGGANFNPGTYTDAIYEDLDEVAGVHEEEPYKNALALSNAQLAVIYNDWNHRYAKDFDNKDLIGAIQDDWTIWNEAWA